MTDFFLSYTSADTRWAEWVAFTLEEAGFSTVIQAWDFRPGSNFVLEMQRAASSADRTILILSPDYLKSQFAAPEWAASFGNDPVGMQRKLIPVMVRKCSPDGLLRSIVHISILDLDEAAAREQLILGIKATRAKPTKRPGFPGTADQSNGKGFPGVGKIVGEIATQAVYMPAMRRAASDMEKRQFIKRTFDVIQDNFKSGLTQLSNTNPMIEHDLILEPQWNLQLKSFWVEPAFVAVAYGEAECILKMEFLMQKAQLL